MILCQVLYNESLDTGSFRTEIFHKASRAAAADDTTPRISPDIVTHYAQLMDMRHDGPQFQHERGSDPALFARCVRHALETPRPLPRYWVGADAWLIWLGRVLLPDLVLDAVIRGAVQGQRWAIQRRRQQAGGNKSDVQMQSLRRAVTSPDKKGR